MKDSISIRSILTKLDTGEYLGLGGVDKAESDLIQLLEEKLPKSKNRAFNPNSIDMDLEKAKSMCEIGFNEALQDIRQALNGLRSK